MTTKRTLGLITSTSALSLCIVGFTAYGCSSGSKPPAGGGGGSSGDLDASADRNFVQSEGGSSGVVGDGGSALPLGTIPTVDEPDVPCVTSNGVKATLFTSPGGNGAPPVTTVRALGARRFATGLNTGGFITFDGVGTMPKLFTMSIATDTFFTSEGTTIGAMGTSPGKIDYQRYDDQGVAMGSLLSVATGVVNGPSRSWVAAGGGGSLIVYSAGDTLFGAGITPAGALAGAPFTIATNATSPHVAITYAGGKYAIAYAYKTAGAAEAARFIFASPTAVMGTPVDIGSADAIQPVAITPTSAGFVMVVDAGGDDHVYTLPLDATGTRSGPARRLLGGDLPFGLASHDGDVALVVLTNDVKIGQAEGPRAPQFRALDLTGKPTGPWVCLDQRVPGGLVSEMGIHADPTGGYSVVYKSPADASVLIRTDKAGTGAP